MRTSHITSHSLVSSHSKAKTGVLLTSSAVQQRHSSLPLRNPPPRLENYFYLREVRREDLLQGQARTPLPARQGSGLPVRAIRKPDALRSPAMHAADGPGTRAHADHTVDQHRRRERCEPAAVLVPEGAHAGCIAAGHGTLPRDIGQDICKSCPVYDEVI